jgi:hypothetical protein
MLPVGPILDFQLQNAHFNAHLQDLASIAAPHEARTHLARLIRPLLEKAIDVLTPGHD